MEATASDVKIDVPADRDKFPGKKKNIMKRNSTVEIGDTGVTFNAKVSRASFSTQDILDLPELPNSLERSLKQFTDKCDYECTSIYDLNHFQEAVGLFLLGATCFQIYISKRPMVTSVIYFDIVIAALIFALLHRELTCIVQVKLSRYSFFRALTQAGVIIDFDDDDMVSTLKTSQVLMIVTVMVAVSAVLIFGFIQEGAGPANIVGMITTCVLMASNINKLLGHNKSLQRMEAELLSLVQFVEKDFVWARACFSEFQKMSTSEALYRWMKVNIFQRKTIIDYAVKVAETKDNCTISRKKLEKIRDLPAVFQNHPSSEVFGGEDKTTGRDKSFSNAEIDGLKRVFSDLDIGFRWHHLRRRATDIPYGHMVTLIKTPKKGQATLVINSKDLANGFYRGGAELKADSAHTVAQDCKMFEEMVKVRRAMVHDSSSAKLKHAATKIKGAGAFGMLTSMSSAKERKPDAPTSNPDLAIQQKMFGREVSPQNLNDLQNIVQDYPMHLVLHELKNANDNILRALTNIVDKICTARRKNGTKPIRDYGDEHEIEVDGSIDDDDEVNMLKKIVNDQHFTYILNLNWWESHLWDSSVENEDVVVWVFENSDNGAGGVKNELFDRRVLKRKDARQFFRPLRREKNVRDDFDTSRVDKLMTHLYFADSKSNNADKTFALARARGRWADYLALAGILGYMVGIIFTYQHTE
jgi:hypothetical protein